MKMVLAAVFWTAGILQASDVPCNSGPHSVPVAGKEEVGLFSMSFSMDPSSVRTMIKLYCILPFPCLLAPVKPRQELTVTDSNGTILKLHSVCLDTEWMNDKRKSRVGVSIRLNDVPSAGARWVRISGHLFLPLSNGLEELDFGKVELKEGGIAVPAVDPVAVRDALENDGLDVADVSVLETVVLKVMKLEPNPDFPARKEPGVEWKFMVYSGTAFQAEDFVFRDMSGVELKPRRTCCHKDNGHRGMSFLFSPSPRFLEVSVLYQGPPRVRKIPVDLKLGLGGVIPPPGGASGEPLQANAVCR